MVVRVTRVASIGLGIIGSSWAVSFARAAEQVVIFDPDPAARQEGLFYIQQSLHRMQIAGLIQSAETCFSRIRLAGTLEEAVTNADYVQESAPEKLSLKQDLMARLDSCASPEAVIASSTSELLPSSFTGHCAGAHRILVVHPLNPPHLIPAIEICPGPSTSQSCIETAFSFLSRCGHSPFLVRKERNGFAMNRLQIAVLREAWHLVKDGVCTPDDIDIAMRDGLARRWAVNGPFRTNLLSTREGYQHFLKGYADTLKSIADDLSTDFPFGEEFGADIDVYFNGPLDERRYRALTEERDATLLKLYSSMSSMTGDQND